MRYGKAIAGMLLVLLILAACGGEPRAQSISESGAPPESSVSTEESAALSQPENSEASIGESGPSPAAASEAARSGEISLETVQKSEGSEMKITANGTTFLAGFAENSSAEAFRKLLEQGPVTIEMHDYGSFEKVGPLGTSLPTNDEPITTEPGDVILYQGSSVTVYYDTNHWSFTRLGKIENVTKEELLEAFGSGDVAITFALD